ncbi:MAG: hypothetical protein VX083_14515 [Pseudomonadota bacterium]|jgi:hypothetical protein|nr:hypothetical protein [Pseudomonadota bacterium]MEC8042797.1 hypothetical protein [Pseudomonadota bacterium]MEC8294703.1 hypothetical protein [Pseudomonadota bacterium]
MYRYFLASTIYLLCLGEMIMVGYSFGFGPLEFAARGPDGPFSCQALLSSGGDDDAMVLAFVLFAVPFAMRSFQFRTAPRALEICVFVGVLLIVTGALTLASFDCAEVLYTAFVVPNLMLAVAIMAMPVSGALLLYLKRKHPDQRPG